MTPGFRFFADAAHVWFSAFRYGVSVLIVLAGLTWAIIWVVSAFRGVSTAPRKGKWRDIPLWIRCTWLITLLFGAYGYVYAMTVGGFTPTHLPRDGKHWLMWDGKSTEVTAEQYARSTAHEAVFAFLTVLSLYAGSRLPTPAKPKGSGQATVPPP